MVGLSHPAGKESSRVFHRESSSHCCVRLRGRHQGRGVGLWNTGYHGTLVAAGAEPVFLKPACGGKPWGEILNGFCGVVACGFNDSTPGKLGDIESLCLWCRSHRFPLLTIDQALGHELRVWRPELRRSFARNARAYSTAIPLSSACGTPST